MTLTAPGVEPLYVSTFEWNKALDLASRKRGDAPEFGWDRATAQADFRGITASVDDHMLRIISQLRDDFSYGWGQSMSAGDVQALATALTQAAQAEGDAAPDFLPQLIPFLKACAQRRQEVRLEQ